jgi:hypothetical protein
LFALFVCFNLWNPIFSALLGSPVFRFNFSHHPILWYVVVDLISILSFTSIKHIRWCNPIQNICLSTGITLLNILSHIDWCQFKSAGDVVIICLIYSICWIHHRRDSQGYSTHLKHFESTNQDQASW